MDSSGPSSERTHEMIVSEWWDSDERKKERKGAHSNTDCRPDFLEQEQTETHIRES